MTVLLTGAHGTVGTAVTATSAYDHVLLDREPAPTNSVTGARTHTAIARLSSSTWAQTAQSRPSRTP